MKTVFWSYLVSLANDVPTYIYEMLFYFLCLVVVLTVTFCGLKKALCISSRFVLIEYIFLIYCSTVFFRPITEGKKFDFHPFWSYIAIRDGRNDLIAENIMNVLVFVPMGFLLGLVFYKMSLWKIFIEGLCMSMSIEALQFFFHRGFSEVDDIMHNTLGCVIGYGIYKSAQLLFEHFSW